LGYYGVFIVVTLRNSKRKEQIDGYTTIFIELLQQLENQICFYSISFLSNNLSVHLSVTGWG